MDTFGFGPRSGNFGGSMKAAELFPNQLGNAFNMSDAIDNSATEEDPTAGNMGAAFVEIEREEDEWEGWVNWEGQ